MHTAGVNTPASPLEQLRAGLEGPAPSSLVRLHDLAAWLDDALQLHDRARAELKVREVLLERGAATLYGMPQGLAPMVLPVDGALPVSPGRRVLSRGLGGPAVPAPAPPAAIGPGNPPQRAWALQSLQLEHLAVDRATACALFGYPAPVQEVATAAPPAPVAADEWTDERLQARKAELEAQGLKSPMQQLAAESGKPARTIQHRLQQLKRRQDEARRAEQALAGVGRQVVKAGKRQA
jgi:hypothetical protein